MNAVTESKHDVVDKAGTEGAADASCRLCSIPIGMRRAFVINIRCTWLHLTTRPRPYSRCR